MQQEIKDHVTMPHINFKNIRMSMATSMLRQPCMKISKPSSKTRVLKMDTCDIWDTERKRRNKGKDSMKCPHDSISRVKTGYISSTYSQACLFTITQ